MAAKDFLILLLINSLQAVSTGGGSVSYDSGPFIVTYDATQAPTLRVATKNGTVVWYTSTSNATFVTAARVEQKVQQNGGTFVFTTTVQEVCSDMTITRNGTRISENVYNQVAS